MQETPTETPVVATLLHGISEETWGGKFLLGKDLLLPAAPTPTTVQQAPDQPTPRTRVKGIVKYPLAPDQPPVEAYIISKDFGKRGLKGAGVSSKGYVHTTVIPDAYAAANTHMHQDDLSEESDQAVYIWRVQQQGEQPRTGEQFLSGDPALRISEALAVNEDVSSRLSDERTRDMVHASLVLDLMGLGCSPTELPANGGGMKKYYIVVPLGVPANDFQDSRTQEAVNTLKGSFLIEQTNVQSGVTQTWNIEVINVVPEAQPKGTLYAMTRKLNAQPAISKKIITVVDIGGGDVYKYEFDLAGGLISTPERIGDGTIAIARPLAAKIEEAYGIVVSEIEAQEALYKKTIWKSGEEVNISALIEELRPRFANLLTKLTITNRMLTTFLIFTGGGAALLEKEIRAKLVARSRQLQEGSDFLIMPEAIAPVANVVGLFAVGYYKAQKLIKDYVIAYLDLLGQVSQIGVELEQLRRKTVIRTDDQQRLQTLQEARLQLSAQLASHVGQYYPEVQQQIQAQRLQAQPRAI